MARKKTLMGIPEDMNHYLYEWYWVDDDVVCYVGNGSGGRAYQNHAGQREMNRHKKLGHISVRIIRDSLTKGQAETLEKNYITRYKEMGIKLYNISSGVSDTILTIDFGNKKETDQERARIFSDAVANRSVDKRPTPRKAIDELVGGIVGSVGFSPMGKKWLNPVSRSGEFFRYLDMKFGLDYVKNGLTMVDTEFGHGLFVLSGNKGEGKMHELKLIEADFREWNTTERYDVILMNPPFEELGEKFVLKCMGLLKDGGYLGVVMSPFWRNVVSKSGQHKKAYTVLRDNGGFHMIHMYSDKDTTEVFKQNIGHVDTFVWQKGVVVTNTKIINQKGEEYFCDLSNYPQAPPTLPTYIYDQYFDQTNGLKWRRYPANGGNESRNPKILEFMDVTTGKPFKCCKKCVDNTYGKKVIIDQSLKAYHVDNVGDMVVNDRYMFFFATDNERESISRSLDFVIANRGLFRNRNNAWIPGIRI